MAGIWHHAAVRINASKATTKIDRLAARLVEHLAKDEHIVVVVTDEVEAKRIRAAVEAEAQRVRLQAELDRLAFEFVRPQWARG